MHPGSATGASSCSALGQSPTEGTHPTNATQRSLFSLFNSPQARCLAAVGGEGRDRAWFGVRVEPLILFLAKNGRMGLPHGKESLPKGNGDGPVALRLSPDTHPWGSMAANATASAWQTQLNGTARGAAGSPQLCAISTAARRQSGGRARPLHRMGLRSDVLSSCSQTSQEAQPGRPVARGKGTRGTMKIILRRAEP